VASRPCKLRLWWWIISWKSARACCFKRCSISSLQHLPSHAAGKRERNISHYYCATTRVAGRVPPCSRRELNRIGARGWLESVALSRARTELRVAPRYDNPICKNHDSIAGGANVIEIRSRDTRKARSNRRIRSHRAFCSIARARIYFIKLIEHGVQSRIRIFRARISDIYLARARIIHDFPLWSRKEHRYSSGHPDSPFGLFAIFTPLNAADVN